MKQIEDSGSAVGWYPLTGPWLMLGTLVAVATGLITDDWLPGYCVFVLIAGIAVTWRRGDPPVFPFIVTFQWTQITLAYWYRLVTGAFPGTYRPGDVDYAVALALTGLLLLVAGVRLVQQIGLGWGQPAGAGTATGDSAIVGNLRGLFVLVLAAYGIDYLFVIDTKLLPGFDVLFVRLLDLRQAFLVVLWFEVLRRRQGYAYLWVSLAWVFVPRLGAYFSEFKSPLVLLLIVMAATWKPWNRAWWPKSLGALVKGSPILAVLMVLLLVWQGDLKQQTRLAHDQGFAGDTPVERVGMFVSGARQALPEFFEDPRPYVDSFVERLSYITFFSLVLDHVPAREGHGSGELLSMAITNAVMPRYVFPEKPVLPSDSYFTQRFAGVRVADESTSISIGYMAEFYADWGIQGMLISVFGYGCWIGLVAVLLARLNPVPIL